MTKYQTSTFSASMEKYTDSSFILNRPALETLTVSRGRHQSLYLRSGT